jgi:hypothetical protein
MDGVNGPAGRSGCDQLKISFKSMAWRGVVKHPSPTVKI